MKRPLLIPAMLLGLVPLSGATAQDAGATEAAATEPSQDLLSETVDQALKAYDKAYSAWVTRMRAASAEEREALYEERPDADGLATRLLDLVGNEAGTDTQWNALSWAVQNAGSPPVLEKARPLILEHFVNRDELGGMLWGMYGGPEVRQFLQAITEKTESVPVRGQAMMGLAGILKNELEAPGVTPEDSQRLEAEAIRLLEGLAAPEYADIILYRDVKLGAMAASNLFELKNLMPGKPAPEISAEDIDGVAFKLSDYRGKVVMLDFWGDW